MLMIDLLRKLFAGGKNEKKPQEPLPKEMRLSPKDLEPYLQAELDLRLKGFYGKADGRIKAIIALFKEIEAAALEFSKKTLSVENPQYEKIAKQMKENYFSRIPKILGGVKRPEKMDYESIMKFHGETLQAMLQITKITSDNRYLVIFYKEEFGKLGGPIKALSEEEDALGKLVAENSPTYESAGRIGSSIRTAHALIAEIEEKNLRKAGLEAGLEESAGRYRKSEEESEMEKAIILDRRKKELEGIISGYKGGIAALIQPMERLLRKFEKASSDRKLGKTADAYLKDHLAAARSEGIELSELRALCTEIGKLLVENKIEEEARDKNKHLGIIRRILAGEVRELMERLGKAERELEGVEVQIRGSHALLEGFARSKRAISDSETKVANASAEIAADTKALMELAVGIEKEAGGFLGARLTLDI